MKKILLISAGFLLLSANAFANDGQSQVQYDLRVDGMTCPFCAATSEKALKKVEGVTKVSTNLDTATISVCASNEADLADEKLARLLKKKGFTYVGKTKQAACSIADKKKK